MTENNDQPSDVIQSKIRIEFIHKPTGKEWFFKKHAFLIQNKPFTYGVKVTNISDKVFPGATIKNFQASIKTANLAITSSEEPQIKSLNPKETTELYFDTYTCLHMGALWITCDLLPTGKNHEIKTYQYDKNHKCDEPYNKINKWAEDCFVQGQLELLQSRTNTLILILTSITVLVAVFGLKYLLKSLFIILHICFAFFAEIFKIISA